MNVQLISDFKITVNALQLSQTHLVIGTDCSVHVYEFESKMFKFYRKTRSVSDVALSGHFVSFQDGVFGNYKYTQTKLWFVNLSHRKRRLYQLKAEEGNSIVVFKFDETQLFTLNNLDEFRIWNLTKKQPIITMKLKQIIEDFTVTSNIILMNSKINRIIIHHRSMRLIQKLKIKATTLYSIAYSTIMIIEGAIEEKCYQWHRSQRLIRRIETSGILDQITFRLPYTIMNKDNHLNWIDIKTATIHKIMNLKQLGYQYSLQNNLLACDCGDCVKVYKLMKL